MQEELAVLKPGLEVKVAESKVLMEKVMSANFSMSISLCFLGFQYCPYSVSRLRPSLSLSLSPSLSISLLRTGSWLAVGSVSLLTLLAHPAQVAKEKREVVEPKKEIVNKDVQIADAKVRLQLCSEPPAIRSLARSHATFAILLDGRKKLTVGCARGEMTPGRGGERYQGELRGDPRRGDANTQRGDQGPGHH